jgi:putative ABC transport system permease protein
MPGLSPALIGLGLRNLRSQPGLVAATVGIAALVVAMTAAVPLFARSVSGDLFAVSTGGIDRAETRIAWNGSVHGPASWDVLGAVDADLRRRADAGFTLPDGRIRSLVDSVRFQVRSAGDADETLGSTSLSWHDDLDELARLTAGRTPASELGPGRRIEVLVEQQTAASQGIDVGRELDLALRSTDLVVPATVVGLWTADDADGWVTAPDLLTDRYFADRAVLEQLFDIDISPGQPAQAVRSARWLASSSAADLTAADAPRVRNEAAAMVAAAQRLAPELDADADLARQLDRFVADTASMRRQMIVVMAPVLAALAFFAVLLGRQRAAARRREFELWRLRGADERQVTTVVVVEALTMALLATVLGLLVAPGLAALLGSFDGFLDPAARVGRTVLITGPAAAAGAVAGAAVAIALLTAGLAVRREVATSLAVLGVAVVTVLALVLATAPNDADGFRDPAPFVVPVLLAALAVLLGARVLGAAAGRVRAEAIGTRTAATPGGLALRRLGTSQWMIGPAVLLAVGVAVALSSATVGRSTDRHLDETVRHEVGADWVVQETLALRLLGAGDGGVRADPMTTAAWEALPGVEAATRVGRWTGSVGPPGRSSTDTIVLAVDPTSFDSVAFWRDDYADQPLAELLDRLADGGVVATAGSGLDPGDSAELRLFTGTDSRTFDAPVVGRIERAPTWSTADAPALVLTTLSTVAELVGDDRGFATWIRADGDIDATARTTTFVTSVASADERIDSVREDPVRRGVHGVLSFAAVVLLGLGLLGGVVAVAFADRARAGERSLLRALGFGPDGLGAAAVAEAALLLVPALVGGVAIGVLLSTTMLGRLIGAGTGTPPLQVELDLRLLPVLAVAALLAAVVAHLLVRRRAAAPIDLHSFVNEGDA